MNISPLHLEQTKQICYVPLSLVNILSVSFLHTWDFCDPSQVALYLSLPI